MQAGSKVVRSIEDLNFSHADWNKVAKTGSQQELSIMGDSFASTYGFPSVYGSRVGRGIHCESMARQIASGSPIVTPIIISNTPSLQAVAQRIK